MSALLEVRDLRVGFVGEDGVASRAVDGVSLSVAAGGALGIVGESGCGKTVTALAVMGLSRRADRARLGVGRVRGADLLVARWPSCDRCRGRGSRWSSRTRCRRCTR